jgi:hypothetical protein
MRPLPADPHGAFAAGPRAIFAAAAACLLAFGAAPRLGAQTPPAATEEAREEKEREEARRQRTDPLAAALDARISGKKSPADFAIDVAWAVKPGLITACRIDGSGVGLWNRQVQFRVDRKQVIALLKAVRRARFGTFPAEVGEFEGGEKEIQGRITVTLGDVTRSVAVVGEEKPDEELDRLAHAVLTAGEDPSKAGVRIQGLKEGLDKLASGALAPEALEVLAQRSTDHPAPGQAGETWLLVVSGRRAHDRVGPRGKASTSEHVIELSAAEFRELVALLQTNDAASLPRNLYATVYSRLRVQILNQVVTVEARRFAGMSPDAHADARSRFDRIWEWCDGLHRRAEQAGRKIASPAAPPREKEPAKEKEKD